MALGLFSHLIVLFLWFHLGYSASCVPDDTCTPTSWACDCTGMTLLRAVTLDSNTTLIVIKITYSCPPKLHYVEFGITDFNGTELTVLSAGSSDHSLSYKIVNSTGRGDGEKSLRFTNARGDGDLTSELIFFKVRGYYPTWPHVWTAHYRDIYQSHGPMNMYLCQCDGCDTAPVTKTTSKCNLGYPDDSSSVSNIKFSPSMIWSHGISSDTYLSVFYVDSDPLNLGYSKTILWSGQFINHPINETMGRGTCLMRPAFGSLSLSPDDASAAFDGPVRGPSTPGQPCGRPLYPSLFVTDLSSSNSSRIGDWQQGGRPITPSYVCGVWGTSTKNYSDSENLLTSWTMKINNSSLTTPNLRPSLGVGRCRYDYSWDYGPIAPQLLWNWPTKWRPYGCPAQYGATLSWDLDAMNLLPDATYRMQFMVHSTEIDVMSGGFTAAQDCANVRIHCPLGWASKPGPLPSTRAGRCTECEETPAPHDGSFIWYCFPSNNRTKGYNLIKLPTLMASESPYNSSGFRPRKGYIDEEGYEIDCSCERIHIPCPSHCFGNGLCNTSNGVCNCFELQKGDVRINNTTCQSRFSPNCFNNGQYCSGSGQCLNTSCACIDALGVSCSWKLTINNCSALRATNCHECLAESQSRNMDCQWCPSITGSLTEGNCVRSWTCPHREYGACYPTNPIIVPQCPDNCLNHGACIDLDDCVNGSVKCNEDNVWHAVSNNYSKICYCESDKSNTWEGLNCAVSNYARIPRGNVSTADWVRTRHTGSIVAITIFGMCLLLGLGHVIVAIKIGKADQESTTHLARGTEEVEDGAEELTVLEDEQD